MSDTARLLAKFYGSAEVAQMVLDGQLGSREQSIARAKAALRKDGMQRAGDARPSQGRKAATAPTPTARVTEEQRHADERRASAPADPNKHCPKHYQPVETMRQRTTPAPSHDHGLVRVALGSRTLLEHAWRAIP